MSATLLPPGKQRYTNADGTPLVGGQLFTYDVGTTTPKATFMDAAGLIPNTNPVVLDARGEAMVFWSGTYKVVLKDSSGATIWTVDGVQSSGASTDTLRADMAAHTGPGLIGGPDLTANYVTGTLGWNDQQTAINLTRFPFSCVPDGNIDAATEAGTGTDNAAAAQWAVNWAQDRGKAVYTPGLFRLHNAELTIRKPLVIFSDAEAGSGYGATPTLVYKPRAGFLFTGSGRSVVRTRVKYRGAASDPQDDPLSVAINIQSEFVTLRGVGAYLWFKRPAAGFDPAVEKNNYGSNYDVAVFVGTRVRTVLDNVDIIGYWRQACLWEDVTRASNLPQFSDANGVKFDAGTTTNGSDGTVLKNCFFYGGRWAVKRAGAQPKPGLPWYGYRLTMSATITVNSQPAAGETVTLNGQAFTFVTGSADGSTDILIGADTASTAANIAEAAETYTVNSIAAGGAPVTRCASYFSDGNVVRLFQREGLPTITNAGGSNPFTLSTTSAGLTLSGATMATISDPAPYYDALAAAEAAAAGQTYTPGPDQRGTVGASDLRAWGGWLYGPDHHSGYRIADATGDYIADAATCGGVIYISGMAGNQSRKIQGMQFYGTRISSFEPYRVFADRCNRLVLNGCHIEYHDTSAKTTSGAAAKFDDTDTYGPIALTANAQNTVCFALNANVRDAFIPASVRFTNIAPAGSRQLTRLTDAVRTAAWYETAQGLRATLGDLDYRTLSTSYLHRWRGGTTTWMTLGSGGLTFGSTISAPLIQSGSGEIIVAAASGSGFRAKSGTSTVALMDSGNATFTVTGAIRHTNDNAASFGDASHRATQVFAANNAINTSQLKYKSVRGPLTDAEVRAWGRVQPVVFQWLDAIERKGPDGARLNAGYIADWVAEAFRAEGLDPARYALWCEDPVTEIVAETRSVTRERTEVLTVLEEQIDTVDGRAVRRLVPVEIERPITVAVPLFDEAGSPVLDSGGRQATHQAPVLEVVDELVEIEVQTGETRLGLRYEQCAVFEAAYQRARLAALEQRVATLEGGAS
jgi:hypothetical protein